MMPEMGPQKEARKPPPVNDDPGYSLGRSSRRWNFLGFGDLSFADFVKAMAVIGVATTLLWTVAKIIGTPDLPGPLKEIQSVPGFKELTRRIQPSTLSGDYALFKTLWEQSAIPDEEAYLSPERPFVELYTKLFVLPESREEFRQILWEASMRLDEKRARVKPDIVFRAVAYRHLRSGLQSSCPSCTKESLDEMAKDELDQMIHSCLAHGL
jgi:hypothetical protein